MVVGVIPVETGRVLSGIRTRTGTSRRSRPRRRRCRCCPAAKRACRGRGDWSWSAAEVVGQRDLERSPGRNRGLVPAEDLVGHAADADLGSLRASSVVSNRPESESRTGGSRSSSSWAARRGTVCKAERPSSVSPAHWRRGGTHHGRRVTVVPPSIIGCERVAASRLLTLTRPCHRAIGARRLAFFCQTPAQSEWVYSTMIVPFM